MRPWCMDLGEADAWATCIRERAGVDADAVVRPSDLANRFGLEVYQGKGLKLRRDGELAAWGGRRYIAIRAGITVERARFAVLHEIAEEALRGQIDDDIERACNAIAGALAMPRRTFLCALREVGEDPHALAALFKVTPTAAALRIGETTQMPLAALTPSWLWIRGRPIVWPPETELRRIARVGRPGLRRIALEPRRIAIIVDGVDEAI